MKVAAICCTYLRPAELANAVECFLKQDYPSELREMVILDDAGQYSPDVFRGLVGVRLVVSPVRFRTLGEKRNASAALVSSDVDAYCVWDDDDVYLPWHISAAVGALKNADYTIPKGLFVEKSGKLEFKENQYLFHGSWSFRREAFEKVDGYPFIQSGQDQGLLRRFKAKSLVRNDPLCVDRRPSYVYRWYTTPCNWHLSALGKGGYERLGERRSQFIECLSPCWQRNWLALYDAYCAEVKVSE